MRIGVLSDTHGFFDPRIVRHFTGVDHIIHAGDIGSPVIIARLAALAPVTAVTGNIDWGGPLDRDYRRSERLELSGYQIFVTHIGGKPVELATNLPEPRPDIYIYGHSHIPALQHHAGVLFLNPGAAGKPRFGRQPSLALLDLGDEASASIIML
jgi:putative phosphoesterase